MKTKEEHLYDQVGADGMDDGSLVAMQLYADQKVSERDAEILEWIEQNKEIAYPLTGNRIEIIKIKKLKQFINEKS